MTYNYARACQVAADEQGITAIVDALAAAGITADVEQTGGFTMIATVRRNGWALTINDIGGESPILLGSQPETGWDNGDDADVAYVECADLAAMVDTATGWMADQRSLHARAVR